MTVPGDPFIHFQPHLGLYVSFHGAVEHQVRLACSRVKFIGSLVDFGLAIESKTASRVFLFSLLCIDKSVWKPQRPS